MWSVPSSGLTWYFALTHTDPMKGAVPMENVASKKLPRNPLSASVRIVRDSLKM